MVRKSRPSPREWMMSRGERGGEATVGDEELQGLREGEADDVVVDEVVGVADGVVLLGSGEGGEGGAGVERGGAGEGVVVWNSIGDIVWNSVGDVVWNSIGNSIISDIVGDTIGNSIIGDTIGNSIGDIVGDTIGNSIISDIVGDTIGNSSHLLAIISTSHLLSIILFTTHSLIITTLPHHYHLTLHLPSSLLFLLHHHIHQRRHVHQRRTRTRLLHRRLLRPQRTVNRSIIQHLPRVPLRVDERVVLVVVMMRVR